MLRRALFALALLLAPLAAAQAPDAGSLNNTTGAHPGPAESIEDRVGVTYGVLVLIGTLAFVGALAYVSARYSRERPRP